MLQDNDYLIVHLHIFDLKVNLERWDTTESLGS